MAPSSRIVERFDIAGFLESRDIETTITGNEVRLNCPFCHEIRQRFYINQESKLNVCHNCGWKGNLATFLQRYLGVSPADAEKLIVNGAGTARPRPRAQRPDATIDRPDHFTEFVVPRTKSSREYWKYVLDVRKLRAGLALDYGLGYCHGGRYSGRVVVPVYWGGHLVTWVARDVTSTRSVKVLTPPGNSQSKYLFNLDRLWGKKEVVLTEGVFDALRLPDVAVCSFGKGLSDTQKRLLQDAGVEHLVVAFDPDALREAYQVAATMRYCMEVSVVADIPPGEDPGSLAEGEMRWLVQRARPYSVADAIRVRAGLALT